MAKKKRQQKDFKPRLHDEDLRFVGELLSEDPAIRENAWTLFYRNIIPELEGRIARLRAKLSPGDVDKICGRVMDRILSDDYRLLREYEGRCSLLTWLYRPIGWEYRSHLKHVGKALMVSREGLKEQLGDASEHRKPGSEGVVYTEDQFLEAVDVRMALEMPHWLQRMDPEKRWVVLLRNYDDSEWGFPLSEIRALAKARGVPIGEISRRLTTVFVEDNVLAKKQEKEQKLMDRIARNLWPSDALEAEGLYRLIEKYKGCVVKTPFKDIGYILMVDNMNTLRSRFHEALREIKDYLRTKGFYF